MTCSHSRGCWNTLYMYDKDLLWVWSGWGVLIITYSTLQVRNRENLLLLPLWCETNHTSGWGCILMTTGSSRRCWNTLYMHDKDLLWVWTGDGASIITYSMRNQVNHLLPTHHSHRTNRLGLDPYDHWPQQQVLKHCIYIWSRSAMSMMKWVRCSYHIYSTLQVRNRVNLLQLPLRQRQGEQAYVRLGLHLYDL